MGSKGSVKTVADITSLSHMLEYHSKTPLLLFLQYIDILFVYHGQYANVRHA